MVCRSRRAVEREERGSSRGERRPRSSRTNRPRLGRGPIPRLAVCAFRTQDSLLASKTHSKEAHRLLCPSRAWLSRRTPAANARPRLGARRRARPSAEGLLLPTPPARPQLSTMGKRKSSKKPQTRIKQVLGAPARPHAPPDSSSSLADPRLASSRRQVVPLRLLRPPGLRHLQAVRPLRRSSRRGVLTESSPLTPRLAPYLAATTSSRSAGSTARTAARASRCVPLSSCRCPSERRADLDPLLGDRPTSLVRRACSSSSSPSRSP